VATQFFELRNLLLVFGSAKQEQNFSSEKNNAKNGTLGLSNCTVCLIVHVHLHKESTILIETFPPSLGQVCFGSSITTNKMHLLSQIIYSCKTLYMFRTVFPSIIRSSKLRIKQRYMSNCCCCLLLWGMRWNILVKRSTCFGLSFVHHQELKTAYTATVYVKQLLLPAIIGDEMEYSCKTLYVFRTVFRPSSGVQNCVYSNGICQTAAAIGDEMELRSISSPQF
jgi:hypothetical protein